MFLPSIFVEIFNEEENDTKNSMLKRKKEIRSDGNG